MWNKFLRLLKTFYIRIIRSKHSIHSIALAVAVGVFVGCFVPPGLHTVVVLLLAFLLKVDKILSFAATWIANPYTMTFMYPAFCYLGSRFIYPSLTFKHIEHILILSIKNSSWDSFKFIGEEIFFSFLIGGFIAGIVLGSIGYIIIYMFLKKYRLNKMIRSQIRKQYHKSRLLLQRRKKVNKPN
ncbi:MAG: DUF2062 domain-containing protein [Lentisphaerota bacterium]